MSDPVIEQTLAQAQAQAVSGQGPAYLPDFKDSTIGTMGIELELMVLDRLTYDLFPAAPDILRLLDQHDKPWVHTPEITTSMLEVAPSILTSYDEAAEQLEHIRATVQRAPFEIRTWQDFRAHFDELAGHGIVNSIKDFYWDVRPKPEYGTIELRVLDTPLKPVYAAALACYARELCLEWADQSGHWPSNGSRELYC